MNTFEALRAEAKKHGYTSAALASEGYNLDGGDALRLARQWDKEVAASQARVAELETAIRHWSNSGSAANVLRLRSLVGLSL